MMRNFYLAAVLVTVLGAALCGQGGETSKLTVRVERPGRTNVIEKEFDRSGPAVVRVDFEYGETLSSVKLRPREAPDSQSIGSFEKAGGIQPAGLFINLGDFCLTEHRKVQVKYREGKKLSAKLVKDGR